MFVKVFNIMWFFIVRLVILCLFFIVLGNIKFVLDIDFVFFVIIRFVFFVLILEKVVIIDFILFL